MLLRPLLPKVPGKPPTRKGETICSRWDSWGWTATRLDADRSLPPGHVPRVATILGRMRTNVCNSSQEAAHRWMDNCFGNASCFLNNFVRRRKYWWRIMLLKKIRRFRLIQFLTTKLNGNSLRVLRFICRISIILLKLVVWRSILTKCSNVIFVFDKSKGSIIWAEKHLLSTISVVLNVW